MANTLSERLASFNVRSRTSDLEQLIVDVKAERDAQAAQHVGYRADALNFKLAEADRDEAAQKAERADRNAKALAAELEGLEAILLERRQNEKTAAIENQRKAVLAERDALAERIKTEWPALSEGMMALFDAIEANEAQLRAVGLGGDNAEAIARGLPGNWYHNGVPVKQFTKMQIPDWSGKQLAWPRPTPVFDHGAVMKQQRQLQMESAAKAAAQPSPYIWHRAKVSNGRPNSFRAKFRDGSTGVGQISNGESDIQIMPQEAERLNAIDGITVTKLAKAPEPVTSFRHPAA